ncbi:MAG TPA: sigma-54-dependent Fis family transcriptional regulator [Planctomycetaceae bacterium]|nr:sigma-54-dependent Fis family transcriptional regulator [Planctomycetaceae bacterium]HCD00734.1 sigma-54-dependent Fis family transcriptional regulator [Planctomycetaceae bacterium]
MISQPGSLLVVEDDGDVREFLADDLRARGYRTETSGSCGAAIGLLREQSFDVVLCDVHLPDGDGLSVLRWCQGRRKRPSVILLTGYGTIENAVEAMRAGADDYLTKPVVDDQLAESLSRVMARRIDGPHMVSVPPVEPSAAGKVLIGRDPRMQQLFELVDTVARTRTTVLVQGESGTGKTLTARSIHDHSDRRDRPFVEVSCGALSETLLESELFGHVAGAFTGAVSDRPGRFRQADGGTLFLDEIDTASPALQVRLLRAIQDREFEPVGGGRTERVDVRLIVATNKDLEGLVSEGEFREDLYYRVNVITLTQPPLRGRSIDIPLLVELFRERFANELGRPVADVDPVAMECLCEYHWPGNVRELVNVIERAVVLCRGEVIRLDDLPEVVRREEPRAEVANQLKSALADPERKLIVESLEAHGWNRQQSARSLGINRTTLYKKMKRHGIVAPAH